MCKLIRKALNVDELINLLGRVKRSRNRVHGSINIKRYICNKIIINTRIAYNRFAYNDV